MEKNNALLHLPASVLEDINIQCEEKILPDIGMRCIRLNIYHNGGLIRDISCDEMAILSKKIENNSAVIFGIVPPIINTLNINITVNNGGRYMTTSRIYNLPSVQRELNFRYGLEKISDDVYAVRLTLTNTSNDKISNIIISVSPADGSAISIFPKRIFGIPFLDAGEQWNKTIIIGVSEYPAYVKCSAYYTYGSARDFHVKIVIDKEELELVDVAIFRKEDLTPIYTYTMNVESSALLGGMISAIHTMIRELFGGETFVRVIDKGDFKIIIREGRYLIVALALENLPLKILDYLGDFVEALENEFSRVLTNKVWNLREFGRDKVLDILKEKLFSNYRVVVRK